MVNDTRLDWAKGKTPTDSFHMRQKIVLEVKVKLWDGYHTANGMAQACRDARLTPQC